FAIGRAAREEAARRQQAVYFAQKRLRLRQVLNGLEAHGGVEAPTHAAQFTSVAAHELHLRVRKMLLCALQRLGGHIDSGHGSHAPAERASGCRSPRSKTPIPP